MLLNMKDRPKQIAPHLLLSETDELNYFIHNNFQILFTFQKFKQTFLFILILGLVNIYLFLQQLMRLVQILIKLLFSRRRNQIFFRFKQSFLNFVPTILQRFHYLLNFFLTDIRWKKLLWVQFPPPIANTVLWDQILNSMR